MKRPLVLGTLVVALLFASPVRSSAVTSVRSGWWTSAPVAAAPDVPTEGMLLQGGATLDRPVAFGAVSFTLGGEEQPGDLTLVVAANAGTTPNASLTVCPLTNSFAAAQGGQMGDAPSFDCTTKDTAARSADGMTFAVHASHFVRNGEIALALLPSAVTDRIVLDKPDASSLATTRSNAMNAGATPASRSAATASGPSRAPSLAPTAVPAGGTTRPPTSAVSPSPSPPSHVTAAPARIDVPDAAHGHTPTPAIAFVSLVVLMSALWLFAGNRPAVSTSIGGPES